jgi:hypothetical protein
MHERRREINQMKKFEERIFDHVIDKPVVARQLLNMLIARGCEITFQGQKVNPSEISHDVVCQILFKISEELKLRETLQ